MPGEIGEVIPKLSTIALPAIDETVKPDFAFRDVTWLYYGKFSLADLIWDRQLGSERVTDATGHGGGRAVHSRQEMKEAHPEYYALLAENGIRLTAVAVHPAFPPRVFSTRRSTM